MLAAASRSRNAGSAITPEARATVLMRSKAINAYCGLELPRRSWPRSALAMGQRVGAHQREHPIRIVCPGSPDLLPVHHEMIALERRAGRKAREIGAGAGLRIALRPDHRPRNDRRQVLRLLRFGAELDQGRADVIEPLRR